MRYFLRQAPKDQERRNDDRRIALAKIGYGGDRNERQSIAASAFRIYIDRGNFAEAATQLKFIDDPQTVENMLIQRRYTPLWAQLEQLAGPHLEKVRTSSFERAKRAYDAAPEDHEKLSSFTYAARLAGRNDVAIALRSKLPLTAQALAEADEDRGWAIDNVALAMVDVGQHEEADKLFATLNEASIPDSRWRVSMIINRIEDLTTDGKYERARTVLPVTEKSAADDGSDFARQLVRRLKFCILSRSGLKEEAAKVLPEMLAHANDALEPTVSGLLCGGEIDKAEKLALEGLQIADRDKRREFELDFVRALQPELLTSDDPSEWDNAWRALRQRPAIAAAYAKLGRDMPAALLAPRPKATAAK
jgi:tetratricopeptide (TPR) repeat protein